MNKEEIIKYCLTLEDTYKDCPFPNDFEYFIFSPLSFLFH